MKPISEMTDRELLEYLVNSVTCSANRIENLRIKALEDDVALLKQALRSVTQQLAELKKAQ